MSQGLANLQVIGVEQPTGIQQEVVEVDVSGGEMLSTYAKAFVREAYRRNSARATQIALTEQELIDYARFLLAQRVEVVNCTMKSFHKLKPLYIPVFLQQVLTLIGEVNLHDFGLKFIPVLPDDFEVISYEDAVAISTKIGMFIDDMHIVRGGMPAHLDGDKEVMSTFSIAGYMRSLHPVSHVIKTYFSAFLNLRLMDEVTWAKYFRVQYDDYAYIASVLCTQQGIV